MKQVDNVVDFSKIETKYETPRLQTYGKLAELTKGNDGSGDDAGLFKAPDVP